MSLSGVLRHNGVDTEVLITNLERDFIGKLRDIKPDIIGMSVLSTEHLWLEDACEKVKENFPSIPIIVGGIHAILYPEEVINIPWVDYVCTGEGEKTLLDFCNTTENLRSDIRGIAYKVNGKSVINEREHLCKSISDSFEDRDVYYRRYPILKNDELKQFIASRGCPYQCTFCFNEQLQDIFKSKGSYVRMKTPEHLIEEILRTKNNSIVKKIFFADDLFTMNKKWLRHFAPLYRDKINIPYMCATRANQMDDEVADLLRMSGCHTVSFGVESGNERIRMQVLNKKVSDNEIIECADICHRKGLRIQTSNMFCLPDETLEDAFDTIKLNIRLKTDFVFSTIFMPFPGTKLTKYCIANHYLKEDFSFKDLPMSFLTNSLLNLNDRDKIENVQRVSHFLIRYPFLLHIAEVIIKRSDMGKIFYPLLFIGTFLRYKEERKISFWSAVKFLWRFRKSY
jgi:anaerobic magnesium-protoporphyrin IX monomethyl ester cyclase